MEPDLTVLFLTLNRVPEQWAEYHKRVLKEAVGGYPMITISRIPMDGVNLLQVPADGPVNIFRQMLRGAKIATTKYIGIAEDDTLYPPEHFKCFRPRDDEFAYNQHRWWIHTWGEAVYSYKHTLINSVLIAPRELLIETLEERFAHYKEGNKYFGGEVGKVEGVLGLTPRKAVDFYTKSYAVVQFDHDYFCGGEHTPEEIARRHTKRPKPVKAYDIPYWGKAKHLRTLFV